MDDFISFAERNNWTVKKVPEKLYTFDPKKVNLRKSLKKAVDYTEFCEVFGLDYTKLSIACDKLSGERLKIPNAYKYIVCDTNMHWMFAEDKVIILDLDYYIDIFMNQVFAYYTSDKDSMSLDKKFKKKCVEFLTALTDTKYHHINLYHFLIGLSAKGSVNDFYFTRYFRDNFRSFWI